MAASIKFDFLVESSELYGRVRRPAAEVNLRLGRNSWQPYFMYVDSGADYSVVSSTGGTLLGLETKSAGKPTRCKGVGGSVACRMCRVWMRIGEYSFQADVGWAESDDVPLILGRRDVFDRFDITLRQRLSVTEFAWKG